MTYHLFTDGACQPNPGKGGWAFILHPEEHPDSRIVKSGYEEQSTNNQMEITAVLEGLKEALKALRVPYSGNPTVKLFADSKYILNGIETWMHNWEKNNWIKKDKKPVLNLDLWKEMFELNSKIHIICEYIKGHSGHPENEECDRLAVKQIEDHWNPPGPK